MMKMALISLAMVLLVGVTVTAGTGEDEKAIRALQDVFAKEIMTNNPKLRASI